MKKPVPGLRFWRFTQVMGKDHRLRSGYRLHYVRAVVDDQIVTRRWCARHGWHYALVSVFAWELEGRGRLPIVFTQREAFLRNAKLIVERKKAAHP